MGSSSFCETTPRELRSCRFIENTLVFLYQDIRFCCIANSKSIIQEYDSENPLDLDKIIQTRQKYATDPPVECIRCPSYESRNWGIEKKIEVLNICHGDVCNFRCEYCFRNHPDYVCRKPKQSIRPYLEHLAKTNSLSKNCTIAYTAGEPALHPELDELVEFSKTINAYNHFSTNASVYSKSIESVLRSGRGMLMCSVDAGTREVFRKVKNVDAFEKVIDNLRAYVLAGKVEAKYIIYETNCASQEIIEFMRIMSEIKVHSVIICFDTRNIMDNPVRKYLECAAIGRCASLFFGIPINFIGTLKELNTFKYAEEMKDGIEEIFQKNFDFYMKDLERRYGNPKKPEIMSEYSEKTAGKKIVLWGAGKKAEEFLLENPHCDIGYVVDNNPQKWGKDFYGKRICSPEELGNEQKGSVAVICASAYVLEIEEQLAGMGFTRQEQRGKGPYVYISRIM